jgi:uncharacterized membrane protein YeaQ/YmgE (transglycosylase-associated protein family)
MGSIIGMLIIGLLAGILAKALMPGTTAEPKGWLMTIALGIAGSFLVGFLVRALYGGGGGGFIATLVGATIGAMLLIFLFRKFWSNPARI